MPHLLRTPLSCDRGTWIYASEALFLPIRNGASTVLKFPPGWTLSGTSRDLSVSSLSCERGEVASVWKYKEGVWSLKTETANDLNLSSFETIEANEGFWIACKEE